MFLKELPSAYKNGLIFVAGAVLLWILYSVSDIIAPFLVSIVVAYILNPVIRFMEKVRIPRPYGVLTLFVGITILGIVIVVPLTLKVISEGQELATKLSNIDVSQLSQDYKLQAKSLFEKLPKNEWAENYLQDTLNSDKIPALAAKGVVIVKDFFIKILQHLLSFTLSAFSGVLGLIFIPLLTFYILVDFDLFCAKALLLVPQLYRDPFVRVAKQIDNSLSSYLRGSILACTIFGTLMTIGLWIVGLHFSFFLGPLAGVANLIPYLGGLATIVMATMVALSQFGLTNAFLTMMLKVGIALAVIQAIDGFVLQPQVIGENVGLHPLMVMFAFVLGGSLFGLLGMILAVPTTCILRILSLELYDELYEEAK